MSTTVRRVEEALRREGLRMEVQRIERVSGETVVWAHGVGHPVCSVREALGLARRLRAADDGEVRA